MRRGHRLRLVPVLSGVAVLAAGAAGLWASGVLPAAASPAGSSPSPAGLATGPGATTLAGDGRPGFRGDGGRATRAELDAPTGLAIDAEGDLFVADTGNCRVREVPARSDTAFGRAVRAGTIVTVAGGPCGRADPPPAALALDASGDLFVAEPTANRVVVLPAHDGTVLGTPVVAGRVATVAGDGTAGFAGDGGAARSAELDDPSGIATDEAGDLVVADTANCRVRLVGAATGSPLAVPVSTGEIVTVAGTGVCGSAGDDGPATRAEVWDPGALATDEAGDLFVADQGNRTVRVLAPRATTVLGTAVGAGTLSTVAGEGSYGPYVADGLPADGETGELNFPSGLAVQPGGQLAVADGASHAIRAVRPDGAMVTLAGLQATGAVDAVGFVAPRVLDPVGVALTPDGTVVYADRDGDVVRALRPGSSAAAPSGGHVEGVGPRRQGEDEGRADRRADADTGRA